MTKFGLVCNFSWRAARFNLPTAALADGNWCLPEGENRNHCGARPERVFEGGLRGLEMDAPARGPLKMSFSAVGL